MNHRKLDGQSAQVPDGHIMPISKETRKFHMSDAALTIGKTIGSSYAVERVLAYGGMSTVYEAKDKKSRAKVAIKIYNANGELDLLNPTYVLAKAAAIAKVKHPHLVEVFDMGIHEDKAFVIMELLSGITLQSYLAYNENPSWKSSKRIILQICCGLDALHKSEIIHMDVKPSNIFITENGEVKVFDFDISLAKFLKEPASFSMFIGSEHYASPEQFKGKRYFDPRIDIYSLGIVMYELVSGRHPFPGDDMANLLMMHMCKVPKPPSGINQNLSPQIDAVVMKAIEKKPENRFQNMEELLEGIRNI